MVHDELQFGDDVVNCRTSPVGCCYDSYESDSQVAPARTQCKVDCSHTPEVLDQAHIAPYKVVGVVAGKPFSRIWLRVCG
jgi:hypothetical protein